MSDPTKEQDAEYRRLSRFYRKDRTPENFQKLIAFGKSAGIFEQGDPEVYDEPDSAPEAASGLSPLELAIEQAETAATLRESGQTETADKVAAMTPEQYQQARLHSVDQTEDHVDESGLTQPQYELLSESDRSGLVKKKITNKLGKQQTVWVRTTQDQPSNKLSGGTDDKPASDTSTAPKQQADASHVPHVEHTANIDETGDVIAKKHISQFGANPVPPATLDKIRSEVAGMRYLTQRDYLNEIGLPPLLRRGLPKEIAANAVHHIATMAYVNSSPNPSESPVEHAVRYFPKLAAVKGKLDIQNAEVPAVRKLVADLALMPEKTLEALTQANVEHYFGNGPITGLDDMGRLKDVQPPGYAAGETYANCYGAFDTGRNKGVYGAGVGSAGSYSMPAHEAAHGIDNVLKITTGSKSGSELAEHHKRLYDKLGPYFQQGGPGARRGAEELFAEATATYFAAGRSVAVTNYDEPFVAWLESKIPGAKS